MNKCRSIITSELPSRGSVAPVSCAPITLRRWATHNRPWSERPKQQEENLVPRRKWAHTRGQVGAVCCPQWKRKTHASGVPKAFQVTCFGETLPSCSVGELDRGEKRKGESKRGKRKCLGAQNCCFGGRPSESGSSEGGARSEFVVGV